MTAELRKPRERTCETCGRQEEWDEDAETWRVAGRVGSRFCIHEWDINGEFVPIEEP